MSGLSPTVTTTLIVVIGGVLTALLSYFGGRFAVRQATQASNETRAEVWNAGYRAAAEPHLFWDVKIVAVVTELQAEVQNLRTAAHLEPKTFEPIPEPPPLFPKMEAMK